MSSNIRKCTITDNNPTFPIKDMDGNYYLRAGYATCFKPVYGTGYCCELVKLEPDYDPNFDKTICYWNNNTSGCLEIASKSFVTNCTGYYPSLGAIKEVTLDVSSCVFVNFDKVCDSGHYMYGAKTYTENWYSIPASYYGALQFYTLLAGSLPKGTWQKTSQSSVNLVRYSNGRIVHSQPNCITQAPYPNVYKQFNCVMVCCNACTGVGAILFSNADSDATARVDVKYWVDAGLSRCGNPPYMCRWGCSTGYDVMLAVAINENYTCTYLCNHANQMNTFGVLVLKTICIC